jgi:hypothetical protein
MKVELLYDRACPNVAGARENLEEALRSMKLPGRWIEWDQASSEAPAYARQFGSPTVLVDGREITGAEPSTEVSCCRLYETSGIPSVALIRAALEARTSTKRQLKHTLLGIPGVALSLLPFGGCPACWPIYGAALSAVGLGFLLSAEYLFPLTAVFLLVSVFTLGFRANTRRGYGPLGAGLMAGALILYGKFSLQQNAVAYSGVAILIAASLWNAWPRRHVAPACPKCVPLSDGLIQLNAKESHHG